MFTTNRQNKVVIVGTTGLVGSGILKVLERLPLPVDDLVPLAGKRSAGTELVFRDEKLRVLEFDPKFFENASWVFFSGKGDLSEKFCEIAANEGAWVIDNSSAFRMNADIPLVVPEVNMHTIGSEPGIIANPNCSTIQLALVLAPIRDRFGLKRVIVSTYQSASGAGGGYLNDLKTTTSEFLETSGENISMDSLAFNCLPAIGTQGENGRFGEEYKLENELRKILEMEDLKVCASAVRVPTLVSHGEAVVIETELPVRPGEARELLENSDGITVLDDFENSDFPTSRHAEGTDDVWVGRIREAGVFENDLAFWVVADNLLKGAALNAVQIAVELNKRS